MKRNLIVAGLTVLLPVSAFAQDHDKREKPSGDGGGQHGGRPAQSAPHQAPASPSGRAQNQGRPNTAYTGQGHFSHGTPGTATVQPSRVVTQPTTNTHIRGEANRGPQVSTGQQPQTQGVSRQSRNQVSPNQQPAHVYSNSQNYNRGNRYGGLWIPENSHSDWHRDRQYYWNHHHYRWYDGGWLIIDSGYNPYYYPSAGYFYGGSVVSNVQGRLTELGYYGGPVDGALGPLTSDAIANYQSDYGLRVTGQINTELLRSLGL